MDAAICATGKKHNISSLVAPSVNPLIIRLVLIRRQLNFRESTVV